MSLIGIELGVRGALLATLGYGRLSMGVDDAVHVDSLDRVIVAAAIEERCAVELTDAALERVDREGWTIAALCRAVAAAQGRVWRVARADVPQLGASS